MKQFFKNLKAGMLLSGVVSITLGLVMICLPEIVETTLRFVFGGGLTLFGVLEIVFVFVKPNVFFPQEESFPVFFLWRWVLYFCSDSIPS